jgi:hypothetical protein
LTCQQLFGVKLQKEHFGLPTENLRANTSLMFKPGLDIFNVPRVPVDKNHLLTTVSRSDATQIAFGTKDENINAALYQRRIRPAWR